MQNGHFRLTRFARDGPLENLSGAGGGGGSTKKIYVQGKIKWKKFMHANQP